MQKFVSMLNTVNHIDFFFYYNDTFLKLVGGTLT